MHWHHVATPRDVYFGYSRKHSKLAQPSEH